jgi:uncharacterized membrane protein YhaH (DUF805 family)
LAQKGAPVLGFLFGFNARLGRMQYLAGMVVLIVIWTAVHFAIGRQPPSYSQMTWPALGLTVVLTWMILMLQSMRIRDIGWDPACVVPAGMAVPIIDRLVAHNVPAWALEGSQGTTVGALISTGLVLALMFWASEDEEGPAFREIPRKSDPQSQRSDPRSVTAERIARAAGAEFGRRGP